MEYHTLFIDPNAREYTHQYTQFICHKRYVSHIIFNTNELIQHIYSLTININSPIWLILFRI